MVVVALVFTGPIGRATAVAGTREPRRTIAARATQARRMGWTDEDGTNIEPDLQ
jgi:hypothetical protein